MRPKEKAQELVDRYYSHLTDVLMKSESEEFSIICSLLCVDEILNDNPNIYDSDRLNHKYWKEVRKELNKL
tara:strand:+ start:503 stop:715 length:213 start_codon:yes stop_codon:yes gene_type:complete